MPPLFSAIEGQPRRATSPGHRRANRTMEGERVHVIANPMAKATFISKFLTYWWMNGIFWKGFKRPLQNADIYKTMPQDETRGLTDRLERLWNEELKDAQRKSRRPRLRNALIKFLGLHYLMLGALNLMEETMKVSAPLLIGRLLSYFQPEPAISRTDAYIAAALLSLVFFTEGILHAPTFFLNQRCGLHLRIATGSLVYRKALRLSQASLKETTTGQIVNLVTSDIQRLEQVAIFFHYLWVSPLMIVIITILCWQKIGVYVLPGVLIFLLLGPLQGLIGRFFAKLRAL